MVTKINEEHDDKQDRDDGETKIKIPKEQLSQTKHKVVIGGKEISYTATAGTYILKEEQDKDAKEPKATASIFYIAYTKDGVKDLGKRPITFSFNGGPGSSSVWLHLGVLGPRRVEVADEDDQALQPPYKLIDNDHSLLDETDLVFIDPVSTGYSRSVPGEKPDQFHDIKKDIESVGEFIRMYTSRQHRWTSPKFLVGESYGTTRAAGLSGYLQERHGMYLNGILLISSILNFQTSYFSIGNDLPYILFLPTYAATARYHGKLSPNLPTDLNGLLSEVEEFASTDYASALMKGATLGDEEKEKIVTKLAKYMGISEDYVRRANLRIEIHRFVKELRRDEGKTVGRLDSRFTSVDRDSVGENYEFDPSYAVIQGPYTATLNDYVRTELEFESDLPYEILSDRVRPWNYDEYQNRYVNVSDTLRKAISMNPHLKVLVANGYYDLATPYFATQYTFNHLDLDESLRENISLKYYEAGHMMYIHDPSLKQLKKDLAIFIKSSIASKSKK